MLKIERKKFYVLAAVFAMCVGYPFFVATGFPHIFYAGCFAVAISCGFYAVHSIFNRNFDVVGMLSSQTMLWFALPFSYIGFFGYEDYITDIPEIDNARTTSIIVMVSAAVFFLLKLPSVRVALRVGGLGWQPILKLALPITVLQAYLVLQGNRGYASVVFGGGEVSLLYQFVEGFSPAVTPLIVMALAIIIGSKRSGYKMLPVLLIIAALIVQILWWTTAGRRSMTFIMLISAITFFSVYYKGHLNNNRLLFLALSAVIGAYGVYWLWESYFSLRLATNQTMGQANLSILDINTANSLSGSDANRSFMENLVTRPFGTITSMTVFMKTAHGHLWGWNTLSQTLLSIPAIFFPGKLETIGPVMEHLWGARLGVPMNDWANTIFIEGYADLGLFGFPVLGVLIALLIKMVNRLGNYAGNSALSAYVYFNILFAVLNVEVSFNGLIVGLRSTLTVILIYWTISFFNGIAIKKTVRGAPR